MEELSQHILKTILGQQLKPGHLSILTCVVKGVLGSVSMVKSFSTKSSLKSELISESIQKQRSCGPSTLKDAGVKLIPFLCTLKHYLCVSLKQQIGSNQLYHRGAGRCRRGVENVVLDFRIIGGGGCDMERLAVGQRRQRQNQLFTGRGEHHVIVERDLLQQLHL